MDFVLSFGEHYAEKSHIIPDKNGASCSHSLFPKARERKLVRPDVDLIPAGSVFARKKTHKTNCMADLLFRSVSAQADRGFSVVIGQQTCYTLEKRGIDR